MKSNLKFIIYFVYIMLAYHTNAMVGPEEKPLASKEGVRLEPLSLSTQLMLKALINKQEIPAISEDLRKKYNILKNYENLGLNNDEAYTVYKKLLNLSQQKFDALMLLIDKIQNYLKAENLIKFRKKLRDATPEGLERAKKNYIKAALDISLNMFRPKPLSRAIFSITTLSNIAESFADFNAAYETYMKTFGLAKE